ncbi:MAG: Multidomain signal transduction protein including CheB-like methylesterase, CheR-like methyltransferase and BaeS-like histidine kinase [uncultured Lysobacter sp.]|uniref:histidine kinase n=1 Tax=uncultured Lysobacter sp. TaxID=271060 RepID=A0A6J4L1E1_9GAMM|nr:MAG: Multidomain signal transduction protein including CheB-like methylesterase, CheR-like methyltransferase and BaeS-like histidine kinase [uncultured Lysobacter sp.]
MSQSRTTMEATLRTLGAAGCDIASTDWSSHALGAMPRWPDELRIALQITLGSAFPAALAWGPDLHVFYNDAYAPILGDRRVRAQGTALAELWSEAWPDLQPIVMRAYGGEPLSFKDQPFEIHRFGKRGTAYFTFSWSPVPGPDGGRGGVLSTLVETTETVLANMRLSESEERLQMALDASGEIGIWSYDPATGLSSGDERCAAIFELDPAVLAAGIPIPRIGEKIHDDDREANRRAMQDALAGHVGYEAEYRVPQRDGSIRWVASKGRVLPGNSAARAPRFTGVLQDVTRRKQVEEEARQASARKDEFLAMLAHELRNPLAPIRAAADLLSMSQLDEAQLRRTSSIISRQVAHMTGLVDDLLDISRVTQGLVSLDRSLLDLGAVAMAAVEQVRPLLDAKGHRLTLDLAADAQPVVGDEKRLVQVVANLLTNAAKYTADQGNIAVRMRDRGAQVVLSVADDGIGMNPELVQRAFELFTQGERTPDRAQGGLGVGLALVRSLVEAHGGSVSVRSEGPGKGSEFEVRLPAATGATASTGSQPAGGPPRAAAPLRVLIVDDNEDAATVLAMFLEALGYDCAVEYDSTSALERALRERPDVCLLDIGLPMMDGNALASQLRSQPETARTLLIAVTGYGDERDRQKSAQAGFDHHLVKPVDTARLAELIAGVRPG